MGYYDHLGDLGSGLGEAPQKRMLEENTLKGSQGNFKQGCLLSKGLSKLDCRLRVSCRVHEDVSSALWGK